MSFSKAKRFVYSPPLPYRDTSSSDDQKMDHSIKYGCSDRRSFKKQEKACNEYVNTRSSTSSKKYAKQSRASLYAVGKNEEHWSKTSGQNRSIEESLSSCSSDSIFYDAYIDTETAELIEDNVNDTMRNITDEIKINENITNKYTVDVRKVNKTLISIQELQYKTVNNIRNETTRKIKKFLEDINRVHITSLEKMNSQSLKIVADFNNGINEFRTVNDKRLKDENKRLKTVVRKLTTQLEDKQKEDEINIVYRDLLEQAEQKVQDQAKTIAALKEELSALKLEVRLLSILRTQDN